MTLPVEWVGYVAAVLIPLIVFWGWLLASLLLSDVPSPLDHKDPSLELTGRQLRKQAEVEWKREFELLMEGEPCTGCAEDWFEKLLNDPTVHLQFEDEYEPSDPITCPRHGHRLQPWW